MAECEECLHNVVCELWRKEERQDAESVLTGGLSDCPIYKSASNIIALPCKVGDTVYVIPTAEDGIDEITEMVVHGFAIGTPCNVANCFRVRGTSALFQPSFDKFGKTVFLTREEAEKVITEIKENKA